MKIPVQQIEQMALPMNEPPMIRSIRPNSLLGRLEMRSNKIPKLLRIVIKVQHRKSLKYKSRGASLFHELADEQNSKHQLTDFYGINQQEPPSCTNRPENR